MKYDPASVRAPTAFNIFWSDVASEYFYEVVLKHQGDSCLIWPFSLNANGYGSVRLGDRYARVHREACILVNGAPPSPAHEAAHRCKNGGKGCVSPHHVRWATHQENMADMIGHGTTVRGDRNPKAKLSERAVIEIRSLVGQCTKAEIARRYGVSHGTIRSALAGRSWGWVK